MNKETCVAFISRKLKEEFELLKEGRFQDKQLYSTICKAQNHLKQNPFCGIRIPKQLWPKEYVKNFGITNLWKYDLPNGWRLIYIVEADDVKIVSIILEWFDHKNYERRFRY